MKTKNKTQSKVKEENTIKKNTYITTAEIKSGKLVVHNAEVVFFYKEIHKDKEGNDRNPSITIIIDKDSEKVIKGFCSDMYYTDKKSKEKIPMTIISDYEGVKQATFRINDYTRVVSGNFDADKLGYKSTISLVVNKFPFSKGGGGISNSVSIIKIISLAQDKDEELLLEDAPVYKNEDDIDVEEMFSEKDEQ